MIYKRYEFTSKEQAEDKISNLDEDVKKAVIVVGKIILVPESADEDDIITEAVLNDGYAIDVLWYNLTESPYGWKSYEVTPKKPSHKILGWD